MLDAAREGPCALGPQALALSLGGVRDLPQGSLEEGAAFSFVPGGFSCLPLSNP